ncbi:MAG TPA: TMEM143 family protein [Pirellulales bacterium]|jgi:hypothetical protein|nr:TMEM143 family protein [Pirellulales bacterium]
MSHAEPAPSLPPLAPQTPPGEDIPEHPQHWRRENYIPVRKAELADLLAKDAELSAEDRSAFRQFCQLLESVFHYEFHAQLEALKNAYAPFDPDSDTSPIEPLDDAECERRIDAVFKQLIWLLERANFVRLSRDDIALALGTASEWGLVLKVDFEAFEQLEVYARGDIVGRRARRRWQTLFRPEQVDVPIYQRLIIVYRFRGDHCTDSRVSPNHVYLKTFKNIPKLDLDMLLPGSQVRMSLLDQGKILLPTVSGVAIAGWKLFQGAVVVAAAGVYGLLSYATLLVGTLGYGVKSFFGYLRTQQKYQLNLTRSLYYQNLDNNAGVVFRLLDEAEEQECREALLAYFFLWRRAGAEGWSSERLDREIEAYLDHEVGIAVDFEVADALAKLERLSLAEQCVPGRWRAAPIERALVALDQLWDNLFSHFNAATDKPDAFKVA